MANWYIAQKRSLSGIIEFDAPLHVISENFAIQGNIFGESLLTNLYKDWQGILDIEIETLLLIIFTSVA